MKEQPSVESLVFVVDDDASVRISLKSLLESIGLHVELFESADDFLKSKIPDTACCLVLDVRLPGLSGLEFQEELAKAGLNFPIIFLTARAELTYRLQGFSVGASYYLDKHFKMLELK
jgi:FixJ family two-component response regulator